MFQTRPTSKIITRALPYIGVYTFMAVLFFLSVVALPHTALGAVKIPFFLIGLYYWAVYRPRLILPWLVFICGFMVDIIGHFPLGLNALLYVVMHAIVISQRRLFIAQNFFVVWAGFAATVTIVFGALWLMMRLVVGEGLYLHPVAIEGAAGIALYPVIAIMLTALHKFLPEPTPSNMFKV